VGCTTGSGREVPQERKPAIRDDDDDDDDVQTSHWVYFIPISLSRFF
jgi:hypothetical protein